MLGIQTWGSRMEGTNESAEQWWHPQQYVIFVCLKRLVNVHNSLMNVASRHLSRENDAHISVTRLSDLLDSGQLFKAFGNNQFDQISHILTQFL